MVEAARCGRRAAAAVLSVGYGILEVMPITTSVDREAVIAMLLENRAYWFARRDLVMVRSFDENLVEAGTTEVARKTCAGCGTWAHPGEPSPVIDCRPSLGRRWASGPYLT